MLQRESLFCPRVVCKNLLALGVAVSAAVAIGEGVPVARAVIVAETDGVGGEVISAVEETE